LEELHKQYLNREKLLDRFGGAKEARKALAMVLSDVDMKKCEKIYDAMKELWALKLKAAQHAKPTARLSLLVDSKSPLLNHFEAWHKMGGTESTLLFGDIDENNAGKFLAQWNVQYTGECHLSGLMNIPCRLYLTLMETISCR
jgi:hypothetical protein